MATLPTSLLDFHGNGFIPLQEVTLISSIDALLKCITQIGELGAIARFLGMESPNSLSNYLASRGIEPTSYFLLHPLLHFCG